MKDKKLIIAVVSAVVFVAAAVTAIIVFREQIAGFFASVKEKLPVGKKECCDECCETEFTEEECNDFADI